MKLVHSECGMSRFMRMGVTLALFLMILAAFTVQQAAAGTYTITTCGDCHQYPPADGTRGGAGGAVVGSHGKHATVYPYPCTTCHVDNTGNYMHRNGYIDMAQPGLNGVSGAYYSRGSVSFPQSNSPTPGTCSTYCHSQGTGNTTQSGDTRSVSAPNTVITWGQTDNCTTCHATPPSYTNGDTTWGAAKRNSHTPHASYTCNYCHNTTTMDGSTIASVVTHANGTYDINGGGGATIASYTYNVGGGTCANVSCHGAGANTAQWGVFGPSCVDCHSSVQTKTKGATAGAWGSIRQVVGTGGDFNRTNRHLRGATTFLKWDCIVCHMEGDENSSAGGTNATYHREGSAGAGNGGKINLRNVDSPTTGWAIDNRTWGTTDYTNMDQFCLNCHDANGASGIAVNNTNNGLLTGAAPGSTNRTAPGNPNPKASLMPFNTTDISAGGQLSGSTTFPGFNRWGVNNLKDKFYAGTAGPGANYNGNPSQHAVIGKRYSTIWPQWAVQTWGSTYVLKKDGRKINVACETAILSCADCHVIDAGANGNAHSSNTIYMLWTTDQAVMCWRCHNQGVYIASSGTSVAGSRINHSAIDARGGSYTAYGFPAGTTSTWPCLLCHANWSGLSTVTRTASYGGIHGSWQTTASWYSTAGRRTAYRFAPGVDFKISPASDTAWGSGGAVSCYFNTSSDQVFSSCTRHGTGSGSAGNAAYRRPPNY